MNYTYDTFYRPRESRLGQTLVNVVTRGRFEVQGHTDVNRFGGFMQGRKGAQRMANEEATMGAIRFHQG